ncbi:MAG: spermidine synthase [Bryobacteraceae bacterium]
MLYAAAIFAGALLLFLVQPVVAKSILPWFGGAAGVWATSMVFFQSALLAGYAYAHWLARRFGGKGQAAIHTVLTGASLTALPLAPGAHWIRLAADHPFAAVLALLATSVGLPFFVLSTSTPLVQSWYAREGKAPYRLYALSNVASLAALLAYPFAMEPLVTLRSQRLAWSAAYVAFAMLSVGAAWRAARFPRLAAEESKAPWSDRLIWASLAACPAAMWMGAANQLSQSVAPAPFLWILPLGIYLLSFVLCFDREGWYRPRLFRFLLPVGWLAISFGLAQQSSARALIWTVGLFSAGLFASAMFCHGELARRKPEPARLTSFYLTVAAGGAAGGAFSGLAAPHLFSGYYELPVSVVGCILLALALLYGYAGPRQLVRLALVSTVGFILAMYLRSSLAGGKIEAVRNFYGSLEVADGRGEGALRTLYNGAIIHGSQFLALGAGRIPTTYYGPYSGAGMLFHAVPGPRRVGVVGLGVGTLAVYGRAGDTFRFYEINPEVIRVARQRFRYLNECPAAVEIATGDARLVLERETAQRFDILVVDAFTGDSIPIHLLTREAFLVYRRHLAPTGVLAFHATNKYVDLVPVLRGAAEAVGLPAVVVRSNGEPRSATYGAVWVLMGRHAALNSVSGDSGHGARRVRLWTDDYSNLFQLLK